MTYYSSSVFLILYGGYFGKIGRPPCREREEVWVSGEE